MDTENDSSNNGTKNKDTFSNSKYSLKVLITGGCGFLGRHIGRCVYTELPESTIILLDVNVGGNTACKKMIAGDDDSGNERILIELADVTNRTELGIVFGKFKPDIVFHCAGMSELSATIDDQLISERMYRANVVGTECVIEACNEHGTKVLVYTGSLAQVLPNNPSRVKLQIDERYISHANVLLLAHSYGQTKKSGEAAVLNAALHPKNKFKACSIRCPPLYGEFDTSFIPNIILGAKKFHGYYPCCGNLNYTMAAMYVGNAAHAHVLAARKLHKGSQLPVNGEVFYVGDNTPLQCAVEFNRTFLHRLGFGYLPWLKVPIIIVTIFFYIFVAVILFFHVFFDSNFPSPVLNYRRQFKVLSVDHTVIWDKARKVLNYTPPVDYTTAFNRSIVWYQYYL